MSTPVGPDEAKIRARSTHYSLTQALRCVPEGSVNWCVVGIKYLSAGRRSAASYGSSNEKGFKVSHFDAALDPAFANMTSPTSQTPSAAPRPARSSSVASFVTYSPMMPPAPGSPSTTDGKVPAPLNLDGAALPAPIANGASAAAAPPRRRVGRSAATTAHYVVKKRGTTFSSFRAALHDDEVQVGVIAVTGIDQALSGERTERSHRFVQVNWIGPKSGFRERRHALGLKLAVSARLGGVRIEYDSSSRAEISVRYIGRLLLMAAGSHHPTHFRVAEKVVASMSIEIGRPQYHIQDATYQDWRRNRWKKAIHKISAMLKLGGMGRSV